MISFAVEQIGVDKLAHFSCYALTAFFLGLLLVVSSSRASFFQCIQSAWFLLILVGLADEYRQWPLPDRSTEFLDAVANLIGVSTGFTIPVLLHALINLKGFYKTPKQSLFRLLFIVQLFILIFLFTGLIFITEKPF